MKRKMNRLQKKTKEAISAYNPKNDDVITVDVLGSYTGISALEGKETMPVQDADDL